MRQRGLTGGLGPRSTADGPSYALCLAPDRVLVVSESVTPADPGWSAAGYAVADMTDGIIAIDVSGPGCARAHAAGHEL